MRAVSLSTRLLALTLLAALVVPAFPATATAHHTFTWETRADLGNTATRVTLALSEDAECSFGWGMGGSTQPKGGGLLFYYIEKTDGAERKTYGSSVVSPSSG
ncbi:MAG: hypothetical protein KY455_04375, partial [Euryarchaeota archaeon]|nr:hypothetical protein [Euryarchaeota archaeon]